MNIHIVQKGDTIETIANLYNTTTKRLEKDNDLTPNEILNIGQAIVIAPPEQTYIVKNGDTLESIAETYGTSILELLRNNPQLSGRATLEDGEELVLKYNKDKETSIMGYSTVFINEQVLRETLPYLTYIIILNYKVDSRGALSDINDAGIIQLAREYGVAPIMFISAMSELGRGSYATTHAILSNPDTQNQIIINILEIMKLKGYSGLDLAFYSILQEDFPLYVEFVRNITNRLNKEGYEVFLTLTPQTLRFQPKVEYNGSFYADFGSVANYVILITYLWQQAFISQVSQTTYIFLKDMLDYVTTQIPPEKIYIGLTRIAYDWEIPYVEGETLGSSLTDAGAINLANQIGSVIEFDETSQTPYFNYNIAGVNHLVWFKDARTVNAILQLVDEYGLAGVAIWNIMYYYTPTWLVINSQYNIKTYENEYVEKNE